MKQPFIYFIVGSVILFLLLCAGIQFPIEFVFFILVGWAIYLNRVAPGIVVNWADVGVAVTAIILAAGVTHWLARWLWAEHQTRKVAAANVEQVLPRPGWPLRYSAALVGLVMLLFAAGTAMIGVTHQLGWMITTPEPVLTSHRFEAALRNSSINNARQLGLSSANIESATGHYPTGCTTDGKGRLLHGWVAQLLPYMEEKPTWDRIDWKQPWDAPANEAACKSDFPAIHNPGIPNRYQHSPDEYPTSHYAASAQTMGGDVQRTAADFSDGTSKTLLLGEAKSNFKPWGSPTNWRDLSLGLQTSPEGFGGPWSRGETIFTYADGHTQAIRREIDPKVLHALSTPHGGETVNPDDL